MSKKNALKLKKNTNSTFIKDPDSVLKFWATREEDAIHIKTADKNVYWFSKSGVLQKAEKNGFVLWFNDQGKLTHSKNPDGLELWFDNEMRVIYEKAADGAEWWYYYKPSGEVERIISSSGLHFSFQ